MNKNKVDNYAFIDSQNLNLGVKSQGWSLDWRKLRQYLKNKYEITKAYLFIGQLAGNESLYADLQECGYILLFKPTLNYHKKDKVIINSCYAFYSSSEAKAESRSSRLRYHSARTIIFCVR